MSTGWIILGVIVVLVFFAFAAYNRLVALSQRVNQAFADIDVQLKQRHDLIPNLIETVKGYASHERQTLEGVVQARNAAIQAKDAGPEQQAQAENVLTGALRQLFALSEAYPDLKANQNFLSLQEELTSTEDRIAYSRQFYNDSVMKYDNKIQSIPSNIIAGMFGFKSREYFKAEEGATEVPRVQF
jgi:LemA protein